MEGGVNMIMIYDLVVGTVLLLVIILLIWYVANIIHYLALRNGLGKGGFFSLAEKWLENERLKKGDADGETKKSGKPAKGGK
jgi:hypothetical protein